MQKLDDYSLEKISFFRSQMAKNNIPDEDNFLYSYERPNWLIRLWRFLSFSQYYHRHLIKPEFLLVFTNKGIYAAKIYYRFFLPIEKKKLNFVLYDYELISDFQIEYRKGYPSTINFLVSWKYLGKEYRYEIMEMMFNNKNNWLKLQKNNFYNLIR